MQTKSFVAILLVVVLMVTSLYGVYQFGVNSGYKVGYDRGIISRPSDGSVYRNGYQNGYADGLEAVTNSTG